MKNKMQFHINKKACSIILCAIALLSFTLCATAHPGRTDSNGGHYDYNNVSGLGSYHYHHGYPAHLHENGVCPYDFDDQTGRDSGDNVSPPNDSSSGRNNYDGYSKSSVQEVQKTNSEVANKKGSGNSLLENIVLLSLVGIFALPTMRMCIEIIVGCKDWLIKRSEDIRIKKKKDEKEKNDYEYYFSCYAFSPPEDFVSMPKGTYIKDGFPCSVGDTPYGIYTMYVTNKGRKFHRRQSCSKSPYLHAVNLVYACRLYDPCKRCVNHIPDISWYKEYKRIADIKRKYNIP